MTFFGQIRTIWLDPDPTKKVQIRNTACKHIDIAFLNCKKVFNIYDTNLI